MFLAIPYPAPTGRHVKLLNRKLRTRGARVLLVDAIQALDIADATERVPPVAATGNSRHPIVAEEIGKARRGCIEHPRAQSSAALSCLAIHLSTCPRPQSRRKDGGRSLLRMLLVRPWKSPVESRKRRRAHNGHVPRSASSTVKFPGFTRT